MANLLAKLANYEINIRSFHPEKDFGWSGVWFEGDNRGFSLKPSGKKRPTSRIWHRFTLDTKNQNVSDVKTKSDKSKAPWKDEYTDYPKELEPKGSLIFKDNPSPSTNIYHYQIEGQYGGVNHAMPLSPFMQKNLGGSYVPTLNVKYKILIDIDRVN